MHAVTHLLVSWTIAEASRLERHDRVLVTWAGVLPDLDGAGLLLDVAGLSPGGGSYFARYHHEVLHGLPGALLIASILCLFATRRLRTFTLSLLVLHVHILSDLLGSAGPGSDGRWDIAYLAPLSDALRVAWNGQWELNAWPNVALTLVLFSYAVWRADRDGRSPAEAFGARADEAFVDLVRRMRLR